MWLLIYILLCIVPLILSSIVSTFIKVRAWIIYLFLAALLLIILIPLVPITNHIQAKYHETENEHKEELDPTIFREWRFSESYSFLFFDWGILDGFALWRDGADASPTSFQYYLRDSGISPELAEKIDKITNPVPFHMFLWLLILSFISFIFKSKDKEKSTSSVSEQEEKSELSGT